MQTPDLWEFAGVDWDDVYRTLRSKGFSEDAAGSDGRARLRPRTIAVGLLELFRRLYAHRKEIDELRAQVMKLAEQLASQPVRSSSVSSATQPQAGSQLSDKVGRVVNGSVKVLDV